MVPLNDDPDAYTEIDLTESVKPTLISVNKRPAPERYIVIKTDLKRNFSRMPFEQAMVNSITRQKVEMNRPKMTETLELTPFTRCTI